MPHLIDMESNPCAHFVGGEENLKTIKAALEAGKKVQWRYSSYKDPGPDWSDVLINGETLPGSHMNGY